MHRPPSTEEVQRRLDNVLAAMFYPVSYKLVQVNGQRKMSSPTCDNKFLAPPEGCEVFVGRLPRDLFEDELVPPFLRMGPIYEVRTMMNFSGTNRGFAFIRYHDQKSAQRAIKLMNQFEIRKHHFIGVMRSVNNRRLFLERINVGLFDGNVEEYLQNWLHLVTLGVENINVIESQPYTCAIVVYHSHRDAAMARRSLIPIKHELFGPEVIVDWADPRFDFKKHN